MGVDDCAGEPGWFPPNILDEGAGEPAKPPRAALALEAPKLGFLITRPEGVVALGVLEPALKENGFEASWPALLLFSPKVKLLLTGSGAGVEAPKVNPDVDDGPPKLAEKLGADPD